MAYLCSLEIMTTKWRFGANEKHEKGPTEVLWLLLADRLIHFGNNAAIREMVLSEC